MNPSSTATETLQPKQHFEVLDGMRGVAALGVVVFHFMEWVISDYSKNFIGHGFLAVDFFFCLSGFVIGYAYDQRIKTIGLTKFFTARLIRLHPLVLFGSVSGLVFYLTNPLGVPPTQYSAPYIALFFLCSILMIPLAVIQDRSYNQFGLNAPAWSLFWEYVANIVYALVLVKISRLTLFIVTIIAAILLGYVGYTAGNLMGGWGKGNFWEGGARVAYSFAAGLLVYRSGWIIKNKLGFVVLSALLLAALLMPHFKWNWIWETTVVLFYFPLLISLGAGTSLPTKLAGLCRFSGKISYPLYMTHYAGIWIFSNYLTTHTLSNSTLFVIISCTTIVMIGFAWLVMVFYDEPVRKWLHKKSIR
ncbi:MAG: acyltransferase [Chitinophagaceae bacterium]